LLSTTKAPLLTVQADNPSEDVPRAPLALSNVSTSVAKNVVTDEEAEDAVDVPFAFVAVTVNVYAVFCARPDTEIGLDPVPVMLEGDEVAVNAETAFPPVAPAVYATVTTPTAVAFTAPMVGACGTVVAVTDEDALDACPVPAALVPVTVNVYAVSD
jgi:hypothetical protein